MPMPSENLVTREIDLIRGLKQMAFFEWNASSDEITWISDCLPVIGRSVGTLLDLQSCVHPDDLKRVEELTSPASTCTPLTQKQNPDVEFRIIWPGGETRWITGKTQAIFDEQNRANGLMGMLIDTTDQKKTMLELEKQQAEHRVIFDSAPTFIWYKDCHNRILRVNQPAAAAVGRAVEEMEGRHTKDFYPVEADKYYQDDLEVIRSGQPKLGIVETHVIADNKTLWVRTDKIPYRNDAGEIIGVIVFAQDITEQKAAEAKLKIALHNAERANQAKSNFLANVSHEIRTPLGIMMGFSELLLSQEVDDAKRLHYADKIRRNGRRLVELVDDLLDLSRIEHGQAKIDLQPFHLNRLIDEVVSTHVQVAKEKGIELHLDIQQNLPLMVKSDPIRLRQILNNILGNAIKFTKQGFVKLSVFTSFKDQDSNAQQLVFLIEDTGRGISKNAVDKLFEPFYQGDLQHDKAASRHYGGTGLGLALSKSLATALGGSLLLLNSELGKGSTFKVEVALHPEKNFPKEQSKVSTPSRTKDEHLPPALAIKEPKGRANFNPSILIVEDNPDIQEMLRTYLSTISSNLMTAMDGQSAVNIAHNKKPDVIIMDLQLPVIDGVEATKQIRKLGHGGPIIALTAHAMVGQRQTCMDAGFDRFLSKPVTQKTLISTIKSALN
jgi:PAS domain S-box-containing protein